MIQESHLVLFYSILLPLSLAAFFDHVRRTYDFKKYMYAIIPFVIVGVSLALYTNYVRLSDWTGFKTWVFVPLFISVHLVFAFIFKRLLARSFQYMVCVFISIAWLLLTSWMG